MFSFPGTLFELTVRWTSWPFLCMPRVSMPLPMLFVLMNRWFTRPPVRFVLGNVLTSLVPTTREFRTTATFRE